MAGTGVLVGVDGSAQSNAALLWAVEEARLLGTGLTIAHVCEAGAYGLWRQPRAVRASLRELTRPIMDEATALVRERDPELAQRTHLVLGSVVPSLLRLAERAEVIVVGRHGRGVFGAHLPGSVTQRLLAHSPCPAVMVVTEPEAEQASTPTRVVLGVDDRFAASAALDFAAAEAARRHIELIAVHCLELPDWPVNPMPPNWLQDERHAREGQLHHLLGPTKREYSHIPVRCEVVVGHPGSLLVDFCAPADLLVLGQHRHAPFLPARSGPTIAPVLHRARCPVIVVGEPRPAQEKVLDTAPALAQGVIAY